jgi:hypothetical protein
MQMKSLNRQNIAKYGIGMRILLVFVLVCFCFASLGISLDDCDDCCSDGHCEECLIGNCCFIQPALTVESVSIARVDTPPFNHQSLILCYLDSSDILPPEQPPRLS